MATTSSHPSLRLLLLSLLLLQLLDASSGQGQTPPRPNPSPPPPRRTTGLTSREDLVGLYSLRASLGLRSRDWPRKLDPCLSWVGVRCDAAAGGRVVALDVSGLRRTRLGTLNPRFAVDGLRNLTRLASFRATGFKLRGPVPGWLGPALAPTLAELDLAGCGVTGPLPSSIGTLAALVSLNLSGNSISGVIPGSLGGMSTLQVLDLSRNRLSGTVPPALGSLRRINVLDLSSNSLSASLPPQLGALLSLATLDLSSNALSGPIPATLGRMPNLRFLHLSYNSFTGPLPDALSNSSSSSSTVGLTQLQSLALQGNNLSGPIPDTLWTLPKLQFLDVSANKLTGNITDAAARFGASIPAATLNLSGNSYYGAIPSSVAQRFHSLGFADISGNYFQGVSPFPPVMEHQQPNTNVSVDRNCFRNATNQRTTAECASFYAQIGLTYDDGLFLPGPNPTATEGAKPHSNSNRNRLIYILVGVFGGIIVIAILVVILVLCLRRSGTSQASPAAVPPPPPAGARVKDRDGASNPALSSTQPPAAPFPTPTNLSAVGDSFTYDRLLQVTSNFDDANLISRGHSGDLYHATLEPSGQLVVVKKIDLTPTSRVAKKESYLAELDFFSRASHTRLVPFLGHCLERDDAKYMVYKFMPNRDLNSALYRKKGVEEDGLQSLDWITRLKIATGAAEALCYLHHECSPPFVHRDIQASSILLDDKFEVRLGSLSEVCIQEDDGNQNVITRLLRISQSSEPSTSGSSRPTCAYDVYCFGKVLLELVTGKLGISGSNDAATTELMEQMLSYINVFEKELLTKILDPSLIVDDDLMEEVWAMAIVAKSCLNPRPSKRPQVKFILKALENPLKVVREENFSNSARLKATSSRTWNAVLFGSWRSTSDVAVSSSGPPRDVTSLKQTELASSHDSPGEQSFNHRKKPSKEIFPEPTSSSS